MLARTRSCNCHCRFHKPLATEQNCDEAIKPSGPTTDFCLLIVPFNHEPKKSVKTKLFVGVRSSCSMEDTLWPAAFLGRLSARAVGRDPKPIVQMTSFDPDVTGRSGGGVGMRSPSDHSPPDPDISHAVRSADFQVCCIAGFQTRRTSEPPGRPPTWRSATQQAWKPALPAPAPSGACNS